MMSLTVGLFTQVSDSGPQGPLVSKNSNCGLHHKLIRDILTLNICVKLHHNRLIIKRTRVMTKFF